MRRPQRLISFALVAALSGALGGCGSVSGWDPSDLLDFLDTKKKLPGDRKPVFPEGVPGLEQGVPKNLYRGSAQEQIDQQNAATAEPAPPPQQPEPKAKRAAKKSSRPAAVSAAPPQEPGPDADAPPVDEGSTAAAPPAPKPLKQSRRRVTTPPPDQPAAEQQQSGSAFPAPLPGGSFSR
jgi:hypothetical protein